MSQENPLAVFNFTKRYGNFTAVKNLSFEIRPGEIFGLLGPNGAGKTSIISTIMTLQKITNGRIEIFGIDVAKNPKAAKKLSGYTPQEIVNHGFFRVGQILKYHATHYGLRKTKKEVDHLLKKLDLCSHKEKYVNQISGGMKRRLMIAKALIHEPKLLLLDEPTAGVDLELRHSLWALLKKLKTQGISILLTTHYLEEAERLCDRVGILEEGVLKQIDEVKNLLEEHSLKKISLTLKNRSKEMKHPLLKSQEEEQLHFCVPPKMTLYDLLSEVGISCEEILDVKTQPGSLEDVMGNILKKEEAR